MESELIKQVVSNGVFAALFVYLLLYVLRQNEKRETRLMDCINEQSECFKDLSTCYYELKDDVCSIKDIITKGDKV